MKLHLHNSITRKKEEFVPLNPPYVGMYVCGPTVYGHPHLGHARSYIIFDVLYRYLEYTGYKVRYIQNITDVGHLQGDAEEGEDKIEKQAKVEQLEPSEIAYNYEVSYFKNMDLLNIKRPSISSRATGHIPEMIELTERLIKKGHAYVTDEGNVYYSVRSFPRYGALSGRNIDDAEEGGRISQATDKRAPEDFALWKKADSSHLMKWKSPWSTGYPGWHVECSAMSMKYIGDTLDIHGGGIDNIFPHHECEIAQSEGATDKPFIRYFIHHNLLTVNGTKMGKSLGNFIILHDLFEKTDPIVLRFYILQCHYRSPLDFTYESLEASEHGFRRLKNSVFALHKAISLPVKKPESLPDDISSLKKKFLEAMNDDINTPQAIAVLYEMTKLSNNELATASCDTGRLNAIAYVLKECAEDILGLLFDESNVNSSIEDSLIELLIEQRNNYRAAKDFARSDEIRDKLQELGITIKDGPQGTTYTR